MWTFSILIRHETQGRHAVSAFTDHAVRVSGSRRRRRRPRGPAARPRAHATPTAWARTPRHAAGARAGFAGRAHAPRRLSRLGLSRWLLYTPTTWGAARWTTRGARDVPCPMTPIRPHLERALTSPARQIPDPSTREAIFGDDDVRKPQPRNGLFRCFDDATIVTRTCQNAHTQDHAPSHLYNCPGCFGDCDGHASTKSGKC